MVDGAERRGKKSRHRKRGPSSASNKDQLLDGATRPSPKRNPASRLGLRAPCRQTMEHSSWSSNCNQPDRRRRRDSEHPPPPPVHGEVDRYVSHFVIAREPHPHRQAYRDKRFQRQRLQEWSDTKASAMCPVQQLDCGFFTRGQWWMGTIIVPPGMEAALESVDVTGTGNVGQGFSHEYRPPSMQHTTTPPHSHATTERQGRSISGRLHQDQRRST
jgi:hypothetical protein